MGWFNWWRNERPQITSERIIGRVLRQFRLPTNEIEPGLWSVTAERRDTYQVSLYLWAEDEQIHLAAACQILVERDLIPRELTLQLLEENHRLAIGSFRLAPQEQSRRVVLGRVVDSQSFPERELLPLGETLIERMQRMVCKLYGMGLIIAGDEIPTRRTPHH